MKACKNCRMLVEAEKKCPNCGGEDFTEKFFGMIIVLDGGRSEIAKLAEVTAPGKYAVKVK